MRHELDFPVRTYSQLVSAIELQFSSQFLPTVFSRVPHCRFSDQFQCGFSSPLYTQLAITVCLSVYHQLYALWHPRIARKVWYTGFANINEKWLIILTNVSLTRILKKIYICHALLDCNNIYIHIDCDIYNNSVSN